VTHITAELEGRRRTQPDGLRGFGATIAPPMRNSRIEVNAVTGAKVVPDVAHLDFDRAREDDDTVFTFMGKQRSAFRARWRLDPEKRGPAAHVRRQQFVVNIGCRKSQLLALTAAHDCNWRIDMSTVLKHQLPGRYSQRIRKTAQGCDRGREQTALDLAEITNGKVRLFGKLDQPWPMRRLQTAEATNLRTLSDLAKVSNSLRLGAGPEFGDRRDGSGA